MAFRLACAAVAAAVVLPIECESAPPPPTTTRATCDVGARPGYFVPGEGPLALLGCARLPVSGQRVEFSANLSEIDGAKQLCINPAYSDGMFIPGICFLNPPVSEFAIRDARHPRQGVKGYGYVIWGTAGSARSVDATFDGGIAHAALLPVSEPLARDYGAPPFTLFVAELPLSAALRAGERRGRRRNRADRAEAARVQSGASHAGRLSSGVQAAAPAGADSCAKRSASGVCGSAA